MDGGDGGATSKLGVLLWHGGHSFQCIRMYMCMNVCESVCLFVLLERT